MMQVDAFIGAASYTLYFSLLLSLFPVSFIISTLT
jgi:hypothetical protein